MDRITAVEVTASGAEVFVRDSAGKLSRQNLSFSPWCLAEKGIPVPDGAMEIELSGSALLNRRWEFSSLEAYENALPELKKTPGVLTVRDLSCQFLSTSNLRLFTGMDFNELVRMQFAVTASADEKSVDAIEVADTKGFAARFDLENCGGELEILAAFNAATDFRRPTSNWITVSGKHTSPRSTSIGSVVIRFSRIFINITSIMQKSVGLSKHTDRLC